MQTLPHGSAAATCLRSGGAGRARLRVGRPRLRGGLGAGGLIARVAQGGSLRTRIAQGVVQGLRQGARLGERALHAAQAAAQRGRAAEAGGGAGGGRREALVLSTERLQLPLRARPRVARRTGARAPCSASSWREAVSRTAATTCHHAGSQAARPSSPPH